jgi:hypothetical protein
VILLSDLICRGESAWPCRLREQSCRRRNCAARRGGRQTAIILNDFQTIIPMGRVSTVVVQRFCKPKVGGSNPSPGTNARATS